MVHLYGHARSEIQIIFIDTVLITAGEVHRREETGLSGLDRMLHSDTLLRALLDLTAVFKDPFLIFHSR